MAHLFRIGEMDTDRLLSVGQAATQFGIPRRTLYTAIQRKRLDARQIGAQLVVTPEEVQHWLRYAQHTPGRPRGPHRPGPAKRARLGASAAVAVAPAE